MESISQYVEQRLKLRVNRQKSVVAPAVERPLLGFQFFRDRGPARSGSRSLRRLSKEARIESVN